MKAYLFLSDIMSERMVGLLKRLVETYDNGAQAKSIDLYSIKLNNNDPRMARYHIMSLPCLNYLNVNYYSVEEIMYIIVRGGAPNRDIRDYNNNLLNMVSREIVPGEVPKQVNDSTDQEAFELDRQAKLRAREQIDRERHQQNQLNAMKDDAPKQEQVTQQSSHLMRPKSNLATRINESKSEPTSDYNQMLMKAMTEG